MPETAIFDHYEVLRRDDGSLYELGRGAMGITYKAFDTNLRCHVALKVINAASIDSDVARQRFVREARSAAQLRHRHVASVFHLGVQGDTYFYAMEFIDGETVESLTRRAGPLDPVLALQIALQVTRALNAAQKHELVHRDIKPSNLMLVHEDDELVVKVIDFGLAKSSRKDDGDETSALSVSGFVGTPHFASPEQLEEKEIDVRSDIYSLGVTLWYMLAGNAPFAGSLAQVMSHHLHTAPPIERLKNTPEPLCDLLRRMLEKDPTKRPQTPADLRKEIECCIELLVAMQPHHNAKRDVELHPHVQDAREHETLHRIFRVGAVIDGCYEIAEDLGEGNSGWAFRAKDRESAREVRLVVLHPELAEKSETLARLEREVEKLQSERHPNFLGIFGIERVEDLSFLVFECTRGFSLLELLRARHELDAAEVMPILEQAAAGVDFAIARGLKRLDLSLHQIAIDFAQAASPAPSAKVFTWRQFAVKLNPIGITREFATSDTWAGGQTIVGGIASAKSELSAGNISGKYVQALAALVYELLGGTLSPVMLGAAGAQPAQRYIPLAGLPEDGNEVLKQALDPARSFATAQDFFRELKATVEGETKNHGTTLAPFAKSEDAQKIESPIPAPHEPLIPTWVIAAGTATLALLIILTLTVFRRNPQTVNVATTNQQPTETPVASAAPTAQAIPENPRQSLLK